MNHSRNSVRGGARLAGSPINYYVGVKEHLPHGFDAMPTRNIAFRCGRRVGFKAGIDTGIKQASLTKQEILEQPIFNRLLTAIARHQGMPAFGNATRGQMLAFLTGKPFERVNIREIR